MLILQTRPHRSQTKGNLESFLNSPHSKKPEDPHSLAQSRRGLQSKTGRGKWGTGQENFSRKKRATRLSASLQKREVRFLHCGERQSFRRKAELPWVGAESRAERRAAFSGGGVSTAQECTVSLVWGAVNGLLGAFIHY